MQMSNYKNPHAMSGAGMDNQDALSPGGEVIWAFPSQPGRGGF